VITVAGIGNRWRTDDAVGLHLVEAVSKRGVERARYRLWEDADALTLTQELLDAPGPVLIVDCAQMGLAPGEWRVLDADAVRLRPYGGSTSTHGLGLAQALGIARGLGCEGPIAVFAVQPFDVGCGAGLSAGLEARFGALRKALELALKELREARR
jgi:hydrogenase maturation protease